MKKVIILMLAASIIYLSPLSAKAGAIMFPQCKLTQHGNEARLLFTLHNPSEQSWRFLQWKTPFDAWFSEFVHITHQGVQIPYEGALMKRGEPDKEDYLTLNAGDNIQVELELTQAFKLNNGEYTVEISPILLTPLAESKLKNSTLELTCPKIQINL
ncbi:hypothetical protein [Shewanella nanhaiensis]|uniref:Protease n=1 Tax=Shewanella nanhaiensis TaxID=2864872 RepID=A0ABS7E3K9_9GAMM|nr:hypothetical protein [Shewanella nanhaiensis]MBW8184250.1 hypothetical protein [Shewanella nanhaiensis]